MIYLFYSHMYFLPTTFWAAPSTTKSNVAQSRLVEIQKEVVQWVQHELTSYGGPCVCTEITVLRLLNWSWRGDRHCFHNVWLFFKRNTQLCLRWFKVWPSKWTMKDTYFYFLSKNKQVFCIKMWYVLCFYFSTVEKSFLNMMVPIFA